MGMESAAGTLAPNSADVPAQAYPAGPGRPSVPTTARLKPAAGRRMATAVRRLMHWDIIGREYYPPQAAVIDAAIRIALAVVDEGRDVEDITDAETAELAHVLAPIVKDARSNAEYDARQGPSEFWPERPTVAKAFLDHVTSGRYEAELLDGTRWAIVRAAQMFAGANAPTTALQARKLVEDLIERRDRSAEAANRHRWNGPRNETRRGVRTNARLCALAEPNTSCQASDQVGFTPTWSFAFPRR